VTSGSLPFAGWLRDSFTFLLVHTSSDHRTKLHMRSWGLHGKRKNLALPLAWAERSYKATSGYKVSNDSNAMPNQCNSDRVLTEFSRARCLSWHWAWGPSFRTLHVWMQSWHVPDDLVWQLMQVPLWSHTNPVAHHLFNRNGFNKSVAPSKQRRQPSITGLQLRPNKVKLRILSSVWSWSKSIRTVVPYPQPKFTPKNGNWLLGSEPSPSHMWLSSKAQWSRVPWHDACDGTQTQQSIWWSLIKWKRNSPEKSSVVFLRYVEGAL
jgi:hypothetical protein